MVIDISTLLKSDEGSDISSLFDFLKEKYDEQRKKSLSLLDENAQLIAQNNHLHQQVLTLKKELKNYIAISINDKIMGKCTPTLKSPANTTLAEKINKDNLQDSYIEVDEDPMNSAIVETFCSQVDKADFSTTSMIDSTYDYTSTAINQTLQNQTSPIISRKFSKSRRREEKTPPKDKTPTVMVSPARLEFFKNIPDESPDCIPETPNPKMGKSKISYLSVTSPKRSPLTSTENSTKSKITSTTNQSPSLFNSSTDDNASFNNSIKFISTKNTRDLKSQNMRKPKTSGNENRVTKKMEGKGKKILSQGGKQLKQMNILKSFKKPKKESPIDVFKFECVVDLIENSDDDFRTKPTSPRKKSPKKSDSLIFKSPAHARQIGQSPKKFKSPIAGPSNYGMKKKLDETSCETDVLGINRNFPKRNKREIDDTITFNSPKMHKSPRSPDTGTSNASFRRVKKKLLYNETIDEADSLLDDLMKSQESPPKKKMLGRPQQKPSSPEDFLYVRGAVKKKSDRQKLQGWACEECRKYYEAAKLSDSEMQQKINTCSRHRNNYDPFVSNTPPGFWNPEFPPTQENNRTQTGSKITSK